MKLNLGSSNPRGKYRQPPWVCVDLQRATLSGRAVAASAEALPFRDGCFNEVHAIHMLEHTSRTLHKPILAEIARVMVPEGVAFIEVPDFAEECRCVWRAHEKGRHEHLRLMTVSIYGKGRHAGDWHHWGFTEHTLQQLAESVGLRAERQREMISGHHKQEPVILMRMVKV